MPDRSTSDSVFAEWTGRLSDTALPTLFGRILQGRHTGVLSVSYLGETRYFFFEKGELRIATSTNEENRLGSFLKRRGHITEHDLDWVLDFIDREGRPRLGKVLVTMQLIPRDVIENEARNLFQEIVFSSFFWPDGLYQFRPNSGSLDPAVAMDLSTATVIVEGVRNMPDSPQFLERLGDLARVPKFSPATERFRELPLLPPEAYLLSQVDGKTDAATILKLLPGPRAVAAKMLYALHACGLLELAAAAPRRPTSGVQIRPPSANEKLVRDTYRRAAYLSHYELLGVSPDATLSEIEKAHTRLATIFDPASVAQPDLADCGRELKALAERLHKAYGVLRDPFTRELYDRTLAASAPPAPEVAAAAAETPDSPGTVATTSAGLEAQRRVRARQAFEKARALVDGENYGPAVRLLQEAVRSCPDNAEYRYLLGVAALHTPRLAEKGLDELKEAANQLRDRSDVQAALAEALRERGRLDEARPHARRAAQLSPSNSVYRDLADSIDAEIAAPKGSRRTGVFKTLRKE
jgi:curved DNA-binding protein CbpA